MNPIQKQEVQQNLYDTMIFIADTISESHPKTGSALRYLQQIISESHEKA